MNVAWQVVFPALVVGLAVGLINWHRRAWYAARSQRLDPLQYDYRRRQFIRRMQASAMLALVGVALFAGQMIPWRRWPTIFVLFWCGVMLLVVWMIALALADVVATRLYAGRLRNQRLIQEARRRAQGGSDADGTNGRR